MLSTGWALWEKEREKQRRKTAIVLTNFFMIAGNI
jgi:hypothetical protein